ncbi:phosphoribosylamine--glycine ligase [Noviherbaspirillum sp. CPCC 100848]|uniref:phosphoribosylamine--glycine ligase n=1 Tax=Noviherbaspirillum album TaxID=3080276 RepID=A0ABU6J9C4_9BURK|nr:phosphoribosylamine--glycine ligase [Noviherbaspirillum sp. CPCC 100848]MEC4719877.1 phosphoribosylamine--glycine ligase [Noviherbaspirillum sp. CPCC 100848]
MSRRYLIVGYEARDHAIVWKLAQSPKVDAVYVHTGNVAMGASEKVHFVSERSYEELAQFAFDHQIDCTIVGDTSFMESGIADLFLKSGLAILGASQAAAALEGSKLFGKSFMHRHGIRTPRHSVCASPLECQKYLEDASYPVVLKSDLRISSDKSAVVSMNKIDAASAYADIFLAQRAKDIECPPVVLEEFVAGREVSYTILMDGTDWVPLAAVRDYKRVRDNDEGPNTGGMGSYSPVPWLTADIENKIKDQIVLPTMRGLQAEGLQYRGFLYIGIMVDRQGDPWVLEYNTRMGDTEAETILMLLDDDFSDVVNRAAKGSLKDLRLKWREGCAISIAVAPPGYPETVIETPAHFPFPQGEDVMCFGSILRTSKDHGIGSGPGRLACVTGFASNADDCRNKVYETVKRLDKDGRFHSRSDIALELVSSRPVPAMSEAAQATEAAEAAGVES